MVQIVSGGTDWLPGLMGGTYERRIGEADVNWVNIEEEMPPAHERVLLAYEDGNWGTAVFEPRHLSDKHTIFLFDDVTHWAIPQTPPKESE